MSSERLSRLCFTPYATPLRKMLKLFHSHKKLRHCFTWTLLVGKMRFWKSEPTLSWSQELMDSSGTYSQRNPNTRKHVNVLPPWLHYLAPLIFVSQSFPTWRSFSPSTVPPYWCSFGSVLEAGYQQTLSRLCIRGWFHARASHQRKVILWYCEIWVHVVM